MIELFYGNIPNYVTNWSKKHPKYAGLAFTALMSNSTVALINVSGTYKISIDGKNWTNYTLGTVITLPENGDRVYFAARTTNRSCSNSNVLLHFVMTGKIAASGNIQSLLDFYMTSNYVPEYAYAYMFYGCTSLVSMPQLPANLFDPSPYQIERNSSFCYYHMFDGCSSLLTISELPSRQLAASCYESMFNDCINLKIALDDISYGKMFLDTTSVKSATNWNVNMFRNTSGSYTTDPNIGHRYFVKV